MEFLLADCLKKGGATMKKISVPSRRWYENTERELVFPDRWELFNLTSPGMDKPDLSPEQIREKIENPIDGPSLAELARGKRQAVIVFDDMTRPTPVREVAPFVLDILHRAGMKRDQIRFIWALGSHGACDMIATRKKLGDDIVEKYAVYNHDPFQNTVSAGRTHSGLELRFNREFMACDLKIGIGCITAHVHVGFGGGAKIILPGVAGIETINEFHSRLYADPSRTGLGNFENNIMRAECDEAGDLAGLNFKVDCLVNRRGAITDLYAGSFRATHAAGAEEGKIHYGIPFSGGYDIVVSNAYAKANEAGIALLLALQTLRSDAGGTAVLIADAPEGQVPHYVMRSWGTDYGGAHYSPRPPGVMPLLMKKLIVLAPHPDRTSQDLFCHNDDALILKTWDDVLKVLEELYPGAAKVAVIQDGTMQYLRPAG
mgnify:CR=1 FL=1